MKNIGCSWAVCYDIDGKYYDDGKPRTQISAILPYPFEAERLIESFLPQENKGRFYIKRLSQCEVEFA